MLCFFCCFLQTLQGHFVFTEINALILFEFVCQKLDQAVVEIISTQKSITIGRFDIKHTFTDFENRNIESTSSKIEHCNFFILFFIEAIGHCSCGRLIDDAHDIQSGNFSCILGCLALTVIKICGNRHHCVFDGFTEVFLCSLFHFL